jgi:hypothetical protein
MSDVGVDKFCLEYDLGRGGAFGLSSAQVASALPMHFTFTHIYSKFGCFARSIAQLIGNIEIAPGRSMLRPYESKM